MKYQLHKLTFISVPFILDRTARLHSHAVIAQYGESAHVIVGSSYCRVWLLANLTFGLIILKFISFILIFNSVSRFFFFSRYNIHGMNVKMCAVNVRVFKWLREWVGRCMDVSRYAWQFCGTRYFCFSGSANPKFLQQCVSHMPFWFRPLAALKIGTNCEPDVSGTASFLISRLKLS